MTIAYQARFERGPWDGRTIVMQVEGATLEQEVTVLEEEPAITELLAELGVGDPDPKAFTYVLLGYAPSVGSYIYIPRGDLQPGDRR